MVAIIDFEVPAQQFALGRLCEVFPDINIELERVIPLGSSVIPLLWVSGVDLDEFEREVRSDPIVQDVNDLIQANERWLFKIDWAPEVDGLLDPMIANEADVLRAKGGPEAWEFRTQFENRSRLASFYDDCLTHDVHIEILRIYNPEFPAENSALTDLQADALQMSYDAGYWDVPRKVNLVELAEQMEISDTALSQRLRRGVKTIIGERIDNNVERG